jgi:signal peptidase II
LNPDSKQEASWKGILSPINIALLVFTLDQATKIAVLRTIRETIPVIPGLFNIVLVWNKGAAWGILAEYPIILTSIATVALALLVFYFKKLSEGKFPAEVALSLLAGGIAGNLFDRLFRGSVVDFLDFYVGKRHWPAFNVADSAITVSVVLLVILSFRTEKRDEKGN